MDLHEGQPAIHLYIIEIVCSVMCCFRLCMQINLLLSSLPPSPPFSASHFCSTLLPHSQKRKRVPSPVRRPLQGMPAPTSLNRCFPSSPAPPLPQIAWKRYNCICAMKLQCNHCWNDGTLVLSLCYTQEEITTRGGRAHRLCSHSCDRRANLDPLTALIFEALTVDHADFRALTVDFA